uniref:Immunoglobulin V-set domain-containing protein n=1 Tax=Piliocolobus tephrosceles TaxID=591936 RepID=A0A8C9IS79_9PRIM
DVLEAVHTCYSRLCCCCSWPQGAVPEEIHKHSRQTLFLQCQYSPKRGSYWPKSWCQETSPNLCSLLVTSSKPRTAVQKSRYTILDKPNASFFKITMIQLKEDSGSYWCEIYNTSKNFITFLRDVSLEVFPTPMSPIWTLLWLPKSTSRLEASQQVTSWPKSILLSPSSLQEIKCPICLGSADPKLLVSVLCGLLLAKAPML